MAPTTAKTLTTEKNTTKRQHDSLEGEASLKRWRMMTQQCPVKAADEELLLRLTRHFDSTTDEFKKTFNTKFEELGKKVNSNSDDIKEIKQATLQIEDRNVSRNPAPKSASDEPWTKTERTRARINEQADRRHEKYDVCRRSIRLWPVKGSDDIEITAETWKFLRTKLCVPSDE